MNYVFRDKKDCIFQIRYNFWGKRTSEPNRIMREAFLQLQMLPIRATPIPEGAGSRIDETPYRNQYWVFITPELIGAVWMVLKNK